MGRQRDVKNGVGLKIVIIERFLRLYKSFDGWSVGIIGERDEVDNFAEKLEDWRG